MRGIEERIAYFLDHKPIAAGMCLRHTRDAIGEPWAGTDATAAATRLAKAGRINPGTDAPRGSVMLWTGGPKGHGHAALSAGGGKVVSTDVKGPRTTGVVPFAWFARNWKGLTYRGWTWWLVNDTEPKPAPVVVKAAAVEPAAEGWAVGQDKVIKPKGGASFARGQGYQTLGTIDIPKGGHYLLTMQGRLPGGVEAQIQFARVGWGADRDGLDETGLDPVTPPSHGRDYSWTRNHCIKGGGPVAFQIKAEGSGEVHMPTVVLKALRVC